MKKLFDIIPDELFSILASRNKRLYADALEVLYTAYQEKLKITVNGFYSMLRSTLEAQLIDADFSEDGIAVEEAADISGKARFLIRKLDAKGWLERNAVRILLNILLCQSIAASCYSSCMIFLMKIWPEALLMFLLHTLL